MTRYLIFAGDDYYAAGGINDIVGEFDHLPEAKQHIEVTPAQPGRWVSGMTTTSSVVVGTGAQRPHRYNPVTGIYEEWWDATPERREPYWVLTLPNGREIDGRYAWANAIDIDANTRWRWDGNVWSLA